MCLIPPGSHSSSQIPEETNGGMERTWALERVRSVKENLSGRRESLLVCITLLVPVNASINTDQGQGLF